jgi:hypothetical protein
LPRPHERPASRLKRREFRRLVERCRPQGRWVRRVRPVPCPAVDPTARTFGRLFRPILLIPSWEGLRADPEEKRGSCERHQRQIDGRAGKRLTLTRPNREEKGQVRLAARFDLLPLDLRLTRCQGVAKVLPEELGRKSSRCDVPRALRRLRTCMSAGRVYETDLLDYFDLEIPPVRQDAHEEQLRHRAAPEQGQWGERCR